MKKRALVTGCCGFIGSNLVKSLLEGGWIVDGVDDLSGGDLGLLDVDKIRVVPGAVLNIFSKDNEATRDPATLLVITEDFAADQVLARIAEKKYDTIFHLAANPRVEYSVKNPAAITENNLNKTIRLMTACIGNVNRFIFASSSAIYGNVEILPTPEDCIPNPQSPYAVQKMAVELFGKNFYDLYNLDFVALRFFNAYGPGQYGSSPYSTAISAWCDKLQNEQPLRSDGDGEQTRDMVYVGDICDAMRVIAGRDEAFGFEVFNVATGQSLSNNQILAILKERFPTLTVRHASERPGDVKHTLADVRKLYRATDFRALTSFSDGLRLTLEWWRLV